MEFEITAQPRMTTGKGAARRSRAQDLIPCVAYGPSGGTLQLSVKANRMMKLLKEIGDETRLVNLKIEGDGGEVSKKVLIREVQVHPFQRRILHVDFFEPSMDKPVIAQIPVDTTGKAVGEVKGGKREQLMRSLRVRCLASEIPERIKIDVGPLDVGQTLRVEDLRDLFPFEFTGDGRMGVLTIIPPKGKATKEEEEAED